jgi:hypothetical protein
MQVPVRHQLLVVNTFALADAAFISWVGNQSDWSGKVLRRMGLGSGGGSDGSAGGEQTAGSGGSGGSAHAKQA